MTKKYYSLLTLAFSFFIQSFVYSQGPSTLFLIVEDNGVYEDFYDVTNISSDVFEVIIYMTPGKSYYFDTVNTGDSGLAYGLVSPIGTGEVNDGGADVDVFSSTNTISLLSTTGQKFTASQDVSYELFIDFSASSNNIEVERRVVNAVVYDPSLGISSGDYYPLTYSHEGLYSATAITIPSGSELRFVSRQGVDLGILTGGDTTDLSGIIHNDTGSNTEALTPVADTYDINLNLGVGYTGSYSLSGSVLSIDELSLEAFTIYPNPAATDIHVSVPVNASFQITNLLGKIVKKGSLQKGDNTLYINQFASGSYFVTVYTQDNTVTKRLIKK